VGGTRAAAVHMIHIIFVLYIRLYTHYPGYCILLSSSCSYNSYMNY
jgi:hypothetical protein